jgi:hypothetical protein
VILTRLITLSMPASLAMAGAEIRSGMPMPWRKRDERRRKGGGGMRHKGRGEESRLDKKCAP